MGIGIDSLFMSGKRKPVLDGESIERREPMRRVSPVIVATSRASWRRDVALRETLVPLAGQSSRAIAQRLTELRIMARLGLKNSR
jgi:hypothetical protein